MNTHARLESARGKFYRSSRGHDSTQRHINHIASGSVNSSSLRIPFPLKVKRRGAQTSSHICSLYSANEKRRSAMLFRYLSHLAIIFLSFSLFELTVAEEKSLYSEGDHILELNVNNFNEKIYNQKKAFFVEFYSSWCGACIGYAPLYKEFAAQLQTWSSVVQVSAVNCAEEINSNLCREHAIGAFPTIKYFKYSSRNDVDGQVFTGNKHDISTLPLEVAALVHEDWLEQHPNEWPVLDAVDNEASLEDIWQSSGSSTILLGLVVEYEPAKLAWAEMINFAHDPRVRIALLRPDHPAARALGVDPGALPKVYVLKKGEASPVYTSGNQVSWVDVQRKIVEEIINVGGQQLAPAVTSKPEGSKSGAGVSVTWTQFEVQMLDLTSAMYYMLKEEIPRRQIIEGENLEGLKPWIHMMKKYAPGTDAVRKVLYHLDQWLQRQTGQITSDQWIAQVERLQSDFGHPLPVNMTWIACRGSKPYLRGYTCGLWTLAHAMTVAAYKLEKDNPSFNTVAEVIEPLHQFIYRFLSCEVCGQHFHKHVLKTNLSAITRPEHAVLWLWRAHNIVNKVLSGKESDDPAFPKRQFPPSFICSRCWANGEFVEGEVLDFLLKYYAVENIKTDTNVNGQLKRVESKHFNPKFAIGVRNVDRVEESEQRLRRQQIDTNPQRKWKDLDDNQYAKPYDASAGSRMFYLLWLSIAGAAVIFVYIKYRRNRTKFWKTFYYYNDYKLCPWSSISHQNARKFTL